jgi:hypothetical protein
MVQTRGLRIQVVSDYVLCVSLTALILRKTKEIYCLIEMKVMGAISKVRLRLRRSRSGRKYKWK